MLSKLGAAVAIALMACGGTAARPPADDLEARANQELRQGRWSEAAPTAQSWS